MEGSKKTSKINKLPQKSDKVVTDKRDSRIKMTYEDLQLQDCCGCCDLYPGVITIAILETVLGTGLLMLLLHNSADYDKIFSRGDHHVFSFITGFLLTSMLGCGLTLAVACVMDSLHVTMVYLVLSMVLFIATFVLGVVKVVFSCSQLEDFSDLAGSREIVDMNLACSFGLTTISCSLILLYVFVVVLSFYYYRFVRRYIHSNIRQERNIRDK